MGKATPKLGPEQRADKLVELAQAEFGNLEGAEEKILRAAAMGQVSEVGAPILGVGGEVAGCAFAWERDIQTTKWPGWTVRASLLRWLCGGREEAAALVEPAGVRVVGAVIDGRLDLSALAIPFPVVLHRCVIERGVTLDDSSTDLLSFEGSSCGGFRAERARIAGNLHCRSGFACFGEARLGGATIEGDLACTGGSFTNESGPALIADGARVTGDVFLSGGFMAGGMGELGAVRLLDTTIGGSLNCYGGSLTNESGPALTADRVHVTGGVFLSGGFVAQGMGELGAVRLLGATIEGNLDCHGGSLKNESGPALSADQARVTGVVFLSDGFVARGMGQLGAIRLLNATIGGDLACDGGSFTNESGPALDLQGANVRGAMFLLKIQTWQGRLDLTHAQLGSITDDEAAMNGVIGEPSRQVTPVRMDGLVLGRLGPASPHDGRARAEWIERTSEGRFVPGAYETIAAALDRMGHEDDARQVRIAMERRRHKHEFLQRLRAPFWRFEWLLALPWWVAKLALRLILNYGYNKWRPVWIMLVLLLLGWWLFSEGYRKGLMAPASDQVLTWGEYAAGPGTRKDVAGAASAANSDRPSVESLLPPDYPQFNAFIYSLHVLLPIVDLRQQEYWLPSAERGCVVRMPGLRIREGGWTWDVPWAGAALRYYMWFQTLAGWTLAFFLVAGLTGLVKHKASGPAAGSAEA